jgi:hypothetical protein
MLLYLSDNIASAPLLPHLAPGVRRCSTIAIRLGGVLLFFWATTFKLCRQQRDFTAGISAPMFFRWDCGHPLPPSLSPP